MVKLNWGYLNKKYSYIPEGFETFDGRSKSEKMHEVWYMDKYKFMQENHIKTNAYMHSISSWVLLHIILEKEEIN